MGIVYQLQPAWPSSDKHCCLLPALDEAHFKRLASNAIEGWGGKMLVPSHSPTFFIPLLPKAVTPSASLPAVSIDATPVVGKEEEPNLGRGVRVFSCFPSLLGSPGDVPSVRAKSWRRVIYAFGPHSTTLIGISAGFFFCFFFCWRRNYFIGPYGEKGSDHAV
ncbi:hypothetical protein LZ31DRAFT_108868 [Colletotrichum somersetense]|nr:hypothetical protein LZ31DRAFT_108868 [Colletotrichum somersetense]